MKDYDENSEKPLRWVGGGVKIIKYKFAQSHDWFPGPDMLRVTRYTAFSQGASISLSPQAFSPKMKERIDENHSWVTDDGEPGDQATIQQLFNRSRLFPFYTIFTFITRRAIFKDKFTKITG